MPGGGVNSALRWPGTGKPWTETVTESRSLVCRGGAAPAPRPGGRGCGRRKRGGIRVSDAGCWRRAGWGGPGLREDRGGGG